MLTLLPLPVTVANGCRLKVEIVALCNAVFLKPLDVCECQIFEAPRQHGFVFLRTGTCAALKSGMASSLNDELGGRPWGSPSNHPKIIPQPPVVRLFGPALMLARVVREVCEGFRVKANQRWE